MEPPVARPLQDVGPFYYIDCNKFSAADVDKLESDFEELVECPIQFNPLYAVKEVIITNCGHLFQKVNFNNRPCPSCNNVVKYTWEDKSFNPITGRVHAILLEFKNRIAGQKGFVEVTDLVRELDDFSLRTVGAYILRCGHVHSSNVPGREVIIDRASEVQCLECSEKSTTRIPHFAFRDVQQFINKVKAVAGMHQNKIVVLHPAQEMMREASKGNLKEFSKTKLTKLFKELSTVPVNSRVWEEFNQFFNSLLENEARYEVVKECYMRGLALGEPMGPHLCNSLGKILCNFLIRTKNGNAYFYYLNLIQELKIKAEEECYKNGCAFMKNDPQFMTRLNIDAILVIDANLLCYILPVPETIDRKTIELVKLLLMDTSFLPRLSDELKVATKVLFVITAGSDTEVSLMLLKLKVWMLENPAVIQTLRLDYELWARNCVNAPTELVATIAESSANNAAATGAMSGVPIKKEIYIEFYLDRAYEIFKLIDIYSAKDKKFCEELRIRVIDLYLSKGELKNAWLFFQAHPAEYTFFEGVSWHEVLHRLVSKSDKIFYTSTPFFLPFVARLMKYEQSLEAKLKLLNATKIYITKIPKSRIIETDTLMIPLICDIGWQLSDHPSDYIEIVKHFISAVRDHGVYGFNFEQLFLIPSSTIELIMAWKAASKYLDDRPVAEFNQALNSALRASRSGRASPEGSPPKME